MERYNARICILFCLAVAASSASIILLREHPSQPDEAAQLDLAEGVTSILLAREQATLLANLWSLQGQPNLRKGIEDDDAYEVSTALKGFCSGGTFDVCMAFDSDRNFLAAATENGEAPDLRIEQTAALSPRADLVAESGKLLFVGTTPILDDGEPLGYVRLGRTLGGSFANELHKYAGLPVSLVMDGKAALLAPGLDQTSVAAALVNLKPEDKRAGPYALRSVDANSATRSLAVLLPGSGPGEGPWPLALLLIGVSCGGIFGAVYLVGRAATQSLDAYAAALTQLELRPDDGPLPVAARHWHLGLVAICERTAKIFGQQREGLHKTRQTQQDMERKLARVSDLLSVDAGAFRLFAEKTEELKTLCLREIQAVKTGASRAEVLNHILRHVHTLKGNARLFSMNRMVHATRDFEDYLVAAKEAGGSDADLVEMLTMHLQAVDQEVTSYKETRSRLLGDAGMAERIEQRMALRCQWLTSLIGRIFGTLKRPKISPASLGQLYTEYQQAVMSVGREDLSQYTARYDKMLKDMARKMGKQVEPIVLTGNCRFLPYECMRKLNDIFVHCLRNSLDHGIETPLARRAAGKPAGGLITIECNQLDQLCALVIRDDGKGLSVGELKAKAVARGFLDAKVASQMRDDEAFSLVFATGFSTATVVTEVSGRGVGMDVVREIAQQLGGDVQVCAAPGIGTEIHIHFPVPGSRFEARQSVFNLVGAVRSITQALAPHAGAAELLVSAPADVSRDSLVYCDQILFTAAMKELLVTLCTYAPKPCRLHIAVARVGETNSLTTHALTVAVFGPSGDPARLPIDLAALTADGYLADLFLECGLYLPKMPTGNSLELQLSAGAAKASFTGEMGVLALGANASQVRNLVQQQCDLHYSSFALKFFAGNQVEEFMAAALGGWCIVFLDEKVITDSALLERLAGSGLNVVIVAPDIGSLPLSAVFQLAPDPLIIEGTLDETAVNQALEFTIARCLNSHRQTAMNVQSLAAA